MPEHASARTYQLHGHPAPTESIVVFRRGPSVLVATFLFANISNSSMEQVHTEVPLSAIFSCLSSSSFWSVLLQLWRINGELTTSVFRKATNTLQVLSFNSNPPQTHKRSCIKTLFKSVETHQKPKKKKFVTSSDNSP